MNEVERIIQAAINDGTIVPAEAQQIFQAAQGKMSSQEVSSLAAKYGINITPEQIDAYTLSAPGLSDILKPGQAVTAGNQNGYITGTTTGGAGSPILSPEEWAQVAQKYAGMNQDMYKVLMENPNIKLPDGSTQTTTFGNVPDYAAYVKNSPDLLKDFQSKENPFNGDMEAFGRWHWENVGSREGRILPTGTPDSIGLLQPTVSVDLSPAEQAIYDADQRGRGYRSSVAESLLGRVKDRYTQDLSGEGLTDPSKYLFQGPESYSRNAAGYMPSQGDYQFSPSYDDFASFEQFRFAPTQDQLDKLGRYEFAPSSEDVARFNLFDFTPTREDVARMNDYRFGPQQSLADSVNNWQNQANVGGMDSIYKALMDRESSRFKQAREGLENDLMIRGYTPGTEGWNNRFDDLNRAENDFSLAAMVKAGEEQSRLFNLEGLQKGYQMNVADMLSGMERAQKGQQLDTFRTAADIELAQNARKAQNYAMASDIELAQKGQQADNYARAADIERAQKQLQLLGYETSAGVEMDQRAMDADLGRGLFDIESSIQRNNAALNDQAYSNARDWRQQQINEALTYRNQPLNEYNALMSGTQVNLPNMTPYTGYSSEGIDFVGTEQEGWNRNFAQDQLKQQRKDALMQGLFQLGGSFIGGASGSGSWNPMKW